MTSLGPDFLALQVHDPEAAATFLEEHLDLPRMAMDRPGAIVFDTTPIPMAVRRPLPGLDPATATPRPGAGVSIWIAVPDADALHGRMVAAGIEIVAEPADSPFGRHFSFVGPEGYVLTPHDAEPAR